MVDKIKEELLEDIEKYKNNSIDNYDFWNEHIKFVYEEALKLTEIYKANKTVVELGALLHDIALIKNVGDKKEHHINGVKIAKDILDKHNCPNDIKEKVLGCILNHRSSKNTENIEELCVADADILAHFDNIPMLFNIAFNKEKLNLNEVRNWLKNCLEKDYNDLSENTKSIFKEKYDNILEILI